jgi:hypothetical protein
LGFLIAFVVSSTLARTGSDRFLDLLVYWYKGVLQFPAGWGSVFFKLIPLCSVRPLLYHLPVVLKFLLGDMYSVVSVVFKLATK